ncbi:Ribosomal RNA small subunit methyltransferase C [Furfurilactobacillus rossiae]|nr:Ribosomal RNA small subunit methyltransferase C [Furfurilactobacillus rossiae]QLE64792.1 Ribosomal RNA small subunit methyltransferase C [Furfurilactobacillus rossiae]
MMNNHYYTPNPDVVHDEATWNFRLLGHEIMFTTDNGVFSKRTVDYGSRVLLDAVNLNDIPSGSILDMGCGYGPIGLAIALDNPDRAVELVDVNERALALARRNAEQNQIHNATIYTSNQYEKVTNKYAAIVTNPPVRAGKAVVDGMISGAQTHLLPKGRLTVVLQKKQGAPSAKKLMQTIFGNCEIIKKDKGYYILESIASDQANG